MKKRYLMAVIALMAVGFAAISTTLIINGTAKLVENTNDFDVYYSDALVNGVQDLSVINSANEIVFNTTFSTPGEKYVLDYDVTNGSKNYDAELTMVCTGGNEYLSVTNEFDDVDPLVALDTRAGKLTIEMLKSYLGDDLEVTIECSISASAVERDSLAEEEVEVVDPVTFCNAKGYEYGMIYANTFQLGWSEEGDINDSYYLCGEEEDFSCDVAGYDIDGNRVYISEGGCTVEQ